MKKRLLLLAPLLAILTLFSSSPVLAASEEWEYNAATIDEAYEIYAGIWGAQTFTVGAESHSITSIRIQAYRELLPGTITASIRAVDGADHPTGSDLCSGTMDGDIMTTGAGGAWYEIDVDDYSLEASTMYAIVVRATAGDVDNSLHWNMDGSAGSYADGQEEYSTNSGVSWDGDSDDDYMFEVWGEHLIAIERAEVYRSYIEDNDMLVVCETNNTYVPYYPDYGVSRYFDIQLTSADGATILAQTVNNMWGNRPQAIYLSADACSSLTSGSAYRIYLYGDFGANPSTYYTLLSADWRGDDKTLLDSWVLLTAHRMESYYDVSFTTFVSEGEVLNTEGGAIFNYGIPLLAEQRPNIFASPVTGEIYESGEVTEGWSGTNWETMVGTDMATFINNGGTLMGMTGQRFGSVLLIIIYVGLAVFLLPRGHSAAGMIAAAPLILLGVWLRLVDAVFIGVMLSILALFIIYHFWVRNTA